jgi:myo-inositol 2-dehydrogenase / D-chiro-inositol 1-dehydrogenase
MKRRKFIFESMTAVAGTMILPTIIPSSVFGKEVPSDKINIGLIGSGRMAMSHDLPEILKNNIARVVAIAGPDQKRLSCGKKYVENFYSRRTGCNNYIDVRTYEDYHSILDDKDIDAVIIATPDHLHEQTAIESAFAGKDIYLHLPISLSVRGGRLLSDLVKNKGIILQTGTWHGSNAGLRIAAGMVRNGRIGRLETIKIGLQGDLSGPECHHYFDSAAWGMGTELTGPVSVEAISQFPESGPDRYGDFIARAYYSSGITMLTSPVYPNGIKYQGTEGWIYLRHDQASGDFKNRMP